MRMPFFKGCTYFVFVSAVLFISGCASWDTWDAPGETGVTESLPEPDRRGVYHQVKTGETLWRIAKAYDIPVKDIVYANNIPDVGRIETNQLVFVPGAETVKEILPEVDTSDKEFVWPAHGRVVTYFRQWKGSQQSKGIDIRVNPGQAINAARTGRVVFADFLTGYGQTVILDHEDGFYSVYANNADVLVKLDDIAQKNNSIAKAGGYGEGPAYLHFQIRKNSTEDNPLYYLP